MKKIIGIISIIFIIIMIIILLAISYNNKNPRFAVFSPDMRFSMDVPLSNNDGRTLYVAFVDLNDDGRKELLAYINLDRADSIMGTPLHISEKKLKNDKRGKRFFVSKKDLEESYTPIAYWTIFLPYGNVEILKTKTNGYHDIKVLSRHVEGENIEERYYILKFDKDLGRYDSPEMKEDIINTIGV